MKLKECKHGILVERNDDSQEIGMIVGITNNAPNASREVRQERSRTIVLVQWAHGETTAIHPGNLNLFNDRRL